ncbi:MAG: hypothetical protein GX442_24810 [Candidatus Riflebacteria bacterium]|nr:hypothetical protein [Candidatus Riflebacteria bacterium]
MAEPQGSALIATPLPLVVGIDRGPAGRAPAAVDPAPTLDDLLRLPVLLGAWLGRLAAVSGAPWPGWTPDLAAEVEARWQGIADCLGAWLARNPVAGPNLALLTDRLRSWNEQGARLLERLATGTFGWPDVFAARETLDGFVLDAARAVAEQSGTAWIFSYFLGRNADLLAVVRERAEAGAPDLGTLADHLHRWAGTPPGEMAAVNQKLMEANRRLAVLAVGGGDEASESAIIREDLRFCRAWAARLKAHPAYPRLKSLFEESVAATDLPVLEDLHAEIRRLLRMQAESETLGWVTRRQVQALMTLVPAGDPLHEAIAALQSAPATSQGELSRLLREIESVVGVGVERQARQAAIAWLGPALAAWEGILLPPDRVGQLPRFLDQGIPFALAWRDAPFLVLARFSADEELAVRLVRLVATQGEKGSLKAAEEAEDRAMRQAWTHGLAALRRQAPRSRILWIDRWQGGATVDRVPETQLAQAGVHLGLLPPIAPAVPS